MCPWAVGHAGEGLGPGHGVKPSSVQRNVGGQPRGAAVGKDKVAPKAAG